MTALEFVFLGGFSVRWRGAALSPIPSRIARSLLAYLVVHRDRAHSRDVIAGTFWPDLSDKRARRRLSHALWQVQDALADVPLDEPLLEATPEQLRISSATPFTVDVHEFERLAVAVRDSGPYHPSALASLRRAIELYRGDLLSGFYDDWIIREQVRLGQLHIGVLARAIEAAKSAGQYEEALAYARRLTHHAPLREDAHREAMRISVILGRPNEALAQYERCRSVLAEELDTEPDDATNTLHERILQQRESDEAAVPGLTPVVTGGGRVDVQLIGRERERAEAIGGLERAIGGSGSALLLEGRAGAGKTHLAEGIAADAEWRGFTVLQGSCDELGHRRPYAPVVQALTRALTPVRVEQVRHRLDPVWVAASAEAIPALRTKDAGSETPALLGLEGAQRLREALIRVLLALAQTRPLLLIIEDVHWADADTLQVLQELGPRLGEHRMVLTLTFRTEEARSSALVWELLRQFDVLVSPRRLQLGPLDAHEVADLARTYAETDLDERLVDRIFEASGGNPLFVIETLRALEDEGRLDAVDPEALDELPVARTIEETMSARIGLLSSDERRLLDVSAVHGQEASLELLTGAAALSPLAVADGIESLLDRGLLRDSGSTYTFHHELARRVLYDRIEPATRVALHLRVAETLEAVHPDDAAVLAHHFAAGEVPAKALRYFTLAADRATRLHAYGTAVDLRASAIDLLDRVPTSLDTRYELFAAQEAALDVLGRRPEQAVVLDAMTDLVGDRAERRVEVLRRRINYLGETARFDEAISVAGQALEVVRSTGLDLSEPAILTALGTTLDWTGRPHDAVEPLERATDAATDAGDRMRAQIALGNALHSIQRYDESRAALERALSHAQEADDRRESVRIHGALANVLAEVGATDRARAEYGHAIEIAREIGFRLGEAVNLLNLANTLYHRGEIAAALRRYESAGTVMRELSHRRGQALVCVNEASVRVKLLGPKAVAQDELEAARAYFGDIGDEASVAQCLQLFGRVAHANGDLDLARRHHEVALELVDDAGNAWLKAQFLRDLAQIELDARQPDEAVRRSQQAREVCEQIGLKELVVSVDGVRARALLSTGRHREAQQVLDEALRQRTDGVERPYLLDWAEHLVLDASGRREEAARAIDRARESLDLLLAGFDDAVRERAWTTVPEHLQIKSALERFATHTREFLLADAGAPVGRALRDDERVAVTWTLHAPDDDAVRSPVQRRRLQLLRLLREARLQEASPTVADLAEALTVSEATIRRDLAALRATGHDLRTRGFRAG